MEKCDLGKYIVTGIIKEVAERVEAIKYPNPNSLKGCIIYAEDFDNLMQEMLGEALED